MTKDSISSLLTYHVQTGYLSYSQIDGIANLLPDSLFQGKAYRLITNCDAESFNQDPFKNLYWSKSLEGLKFYLSLTKGVDKYIIVEADVDGVDVNLAFDLLNKEYAKSDNEHSKRNNPHALEEEILALDFKNLRILSKNNLPVI